jgi:hypothetical protein
MRDRKCFTNDTWTSAIDLELYSRISEIIRDQWKLYLDRSIDIQYLDFLPSAGVCWFRMILSANKADTKRIFKYYLDELQPSICWNINIRKAQYSNDLQFFHF